MTIRNQLTLTYRFLVESEVVFYAWTKSDFMKTWLFKSRDNEILSIKTDLKVGGKFSILELNKNEKIDHFGEYLEIEKPNKLVFTLEVPWHFFGVSKVSVEINDKPKGCEMIFTQLGIDTRITKDSWEKMFENLKSVIEQEAFH
jgi:uncharacterized protein YndB with AHSA1/START domain